MDSEDLKLREKNMLYPPMFVVNIIGPSVPECPKAIFKFEGATKEIVKEILLAEGMLI